VGAVEFLLQPMHIPAMPNKATSGILKPMELQETCFKYRCFISPP
jgi:hypothetical protein